MFGERQCALIDFTPGKPGRGGDFADRILD
jgi:hypothetical protein